MTKLDADAALVPVLPWGQVNSIVREHLNPVGVWLARVTTEDLVGTRRADCLSEDELDRARRFRNADARRSFVHGRVMLRELASSALNVRAGSLRFGAGLHGKPFLMGPNCCGLEVNVSHTDGWVAVAMAFGRSIGVDIESTGVDHDCSLIAERVCSPAELTDIRSLPRDQHLAAFFKAWTCKESWLKAKGEGLSEKVSAVEVCVFPAEPARLHRLPSGDGPVSAWRIACLDLPGGLAGAVVWADG